MRRYKRRNVQTAHISLQILSMSKSTKTKQTTTLISKRNHRRIFKFRKNPSKPPAAPHPVVSNRLRFGKPVSRTHTKNPQEGKTLNCQIHTSTQCLKGKSHPQTRKTQNQHTKNTQKTPNQSQPTNESLHQFPSIRIESELQCNLGRPFLGGPNCGC